VPVILPDSSRVVEAPPGFEVHRRAFATPFTFSRAEPPSNLRYVKGALYSALGDLVGLSQRPPGLPADFIRLEDPPWCEPPPARPLEGRGCYIGNVFGHYGHFLLEGITATWPRLDQRFDYYAAHPFIFSYQTHRYIREAYAALGIRWKDVVVIDRPMVFDDITVPERPWQPGIQVNSVARKVFARLSRVHKRPAKRLYLSRRGVGKRAIENEGEIEALFRRRGFRIVHPEMLTIARQAVLYGRASVVAGLAGSQLHNVLLCREGTRVIALGDGRRQLNPNQMLCNALMNSPCLYIPFAGEGSTFDLTGLAGELDANMDVLTHA
jgi:hypothetical protein